MIKIKYYYKPGTENNCCSNNKEKSEIFFFKFKFQVLRLDKVFFKNQGIPYVNNSWWKCLLNVAAAEEKWLIIGTKNT